MKVNKLNYEAFALEYLEGTLSSQEMKAMEQFLLINPAIQAELEEMKDFLVLTSEPVVFANKKQLLKTPSRDKAVWMNPWRWSIAASMLLLVAFLCYPKEQTIDPIATIPSIENKSGNTLSNNPTNAVLNSQKDTNEEVSSITAHLEVADIKSQIEKVTPEKSVQQKIKNQTVAINKVIEIIADNSAPIPSLIREEPTEVVADQETNKVLTDHQEVQSKERAKATNKIDFLETNSIALLKVPTDIHSSVINSSAISFIRDTSNRMAKVETQKRRTFKSLIGKLPGTAKGIKISIIPSFFTD